MNPSYGGGAATHTPILVTNVEDNVNRGIEVFGNVDEYKKGYVKTGKLVVNGSFTASLRPNMLKDVLVAAFGSGSSVGGYYKDWIRSTQVVGDESKYSWGSEVTCRGLALLRLDLLLCRINLLR